MPGKTFPRIRLGQMIGKPDTEAELGDNVRRHGSKVDAKAPIEMT
jgi:hypothetical protein